MARRRMMIAGVSAALLMGGSLWASAPASAAEGFTLTPTSAVVGSTFTLTASLPDGGTPCTEGAGVRVSLLPPVGQGDTAITDNGEGNPSPGGIWSIQLDVTAAEIASAGDYRVQVVCASQDLTYGPEILAIFDTVVSVGPGSSTTAVPTTAPAAATRAVAASPAFTG